MGYFTAMLHEAGSRDGMLERHILATASWTSALNDNDFDLLFAKDGVVTSESWLAAFGVLQAEGVDLGALVRAMNDAAKAFSEPASEVGAAIGSIAQPCDWQSPEAAVEAHLAPDARMQVEKVFSSLDTDNDGMISFKD